MARPLGAPSRATRRSSVLAFSLLLVALAACGDPEYQYLRDPGGDTAFKIPQEWTVFSKAAVLGIPEGGSQPQTPDPIEWLYGFDADPNPSRGHLLNGQDLSTNYPAGIAFVQRLNPQLRDQVNFSTLRNLLFPVDGFSPDDIQFIAFEDLLLDGGVRGSHLEFRFREAALPEAVANLASQGMASGPSGLGGVSGRLFAPTFVHVSQVSLLDARTDRVYYIAVLCSAECFQSHALQIRSIIDSWTVKPS
jgi:hypothetical protein